MTSAMTSSLKSLHDQLLSQKPEGAVHEADGCPFCAADDGGGSMTTYTEDELKTKVDEAVKAACEERDAQIAKLTESQQTTETAKAVADAVAEKDKEIAEIRKDLDENVLKVANLTAERDTIVAWLEGEQKAQTEKAEADARKGERLKALKEAANFPDDYLEKNADRFAAMSDEDFAARIADYQALGAGGNGAGSSQIPPGIPTLRAGLEGPGSNGAASATKELFALRRDPRGHVDLSSL